MLSYIFLYMIGRQLNMGSAYWVLFWGGMTVSIVTAFARFMMNRDSWKR